MCCWQKAWRPVYNVCEHGASVADTDEEVSRLSRGPEDARVVDGIHLILVHLLHVMPVSSFMMPSCLYCR
jgi:hypothetical protein